MYCIISIDYLQKKEEKMRKLLVFLIAIITMTSTVQAAENCYITYIEPEISYNIVPAGVKVEFPNGESSDNVFCNGRLSVPLIDGVKLMGGTLKSQVMGYNITVEGQSCSLNNGVTSNRPVMFAYNNVEYVSLYELITPFDYELLVDLEGNSIKVIKEVCSNDSTLYSMPTSDSKEAHIRLEDIVADGLKPGGEGNYTVDMLEKLKYMSRYLYDRNQEYYIAWIPIYAYPAADYYNDVSTDYNLYNSYFLYVIDYMVDHNGHLGLHGYTHQYGDEESAVGYEWGENTPYSSTEQQRRMVAAKETCHRLGYNEEFFEFPHYGATDEQLLMAEHYFDAIYQPYPDENNLNYLTYTTRSGNKVYYIPTPADYVHFIRDDSIFDKIKSCVDNGYALSLFFHPVIDKNQFEIETVDNERVWSFPQKSTLGRIVDYTVRLGYGFSNFR